MLLVINYSMIHNIHTIMSQLIVAMGEMDPVNRIVPLTDDRGENNEHREGL